MRAEQSASFSQTNFLSLKSHAEVGVFINNISLYEHKMLISKPSISLSFPEYLLKGFKPFKTMPLYSSEDELFSERQYSLLRNRVYYKKPLEELRNKIYNIYNEHQEKNWDGYGAKPIKYLSQSLQFAEALCLESRTLIESVDVIPENDGCLCFEWFHSHSKFMDISIKDDKLIYNYKFGDEKACGETNFSGKHILIEQIKKMV